MTPLNRREFLTTALGGLLVTAPNSRSATDLSKVLPGSDPVRINSAGKFIHECSLPGDTRADDVFPAHPNGIQLSRDRFLILYATRGWRGVDEDNSIIYQVRAGSFTGPILKVGRFVRAIDDWDPFDDGSSFKRNQGHPSAFGVPAGALFGSKPAAHGNLFVASWYQLARKFGAPGQVVKLREAKEIYERTTHVEWVQFRLNDRGDDLDVLASIAPLRRRGAPSRKRSDPLHVGGSMNHGFGAVVPLNREATEWTQIHAVAADDGHSSMIAPVKFRYDRATHRYEWIETGPRLFDPNLGAHEASVIRLDDGWAVCARADDTLKRPALWLRSDDLFSPRAKPSVYADSSAEHPVVRAPVAAYRCADGRVRVLTGDPERSPGNRARNPFFCWDVDPTRGFALSHRRVIIELPTNGNPFRYDSVPMADMGKVLPHTGGTRQLILHRVRTGSINTLSDNRPPVNQDEKNAHGIYHAYIEYESEQPAAWQFA